MGRAASPDWSEVTCSGKKAKCKHCDIEFKKDLARVQPHFCTEWDGHRHVKVCTKAPDSVKTGFQKRRDTAERAKARKRKLQEEAAADARDNKKSKQTDLASGFAAAEKNHLDAVIAKFFYANAISFNVAGSPEWHEVVRELKKAGTGYKSPAREKLRTSLLISVRQELDGQLRHAGILQVEDADGEVADELRSFGSALCSDGWTSTSRRPLLNIIQVSTKGAFFVARTKLLSTRPTN